MLLQNVTDIGAYRRQLEKDDAERKALYGDLLIGVTRFFRDPSRWTAFTKQVFPMLLDVQPEAPLRIWVPACSTGEEVYSLVMLLVEYLAEKNLERRAQIFGSDIREDSIAFARSGIYPKAIEEMVSPERLRRFFTPAAGGGYSIARTSGSCAFLQNTIF